MAALARATEDCLHCARGAGLLEPDRVDVYERWTTRAAVERFRGTGTSGDLDAQIVGADGSSPSRF
ncbi:hypothetical protein ACW9HJ_09040 [Nocardia gipuzkoensis]